MSRKVKPSQTVAKKISAKPVVKKAPKRATKEDEGFVTVDIDIDPDTKAALDSVARLAKVSFDQVVSVLLAMKVLKDAELKKTEACFED